MTVLEQDILLSMLNRIGTLSLYGEILYLLERERREYCKKHTHGTTCDYLSSDIQELVKMITVLHNKNDLMLHTGLMDRKQILDRVAV